MKTPPKSSAKVYRDAAAIIANKSQDYCCPSIGYSDESERLKLFMAFLFKPERGEGVLGWWPDRKRSRQQNVEPRILALLLAAEIVERGAL